MSKWIEVDGNHFFARCWGDETKPLLLMLHGFPEYSGAWEELAHLLSDHFHCIAPDQRGYGRSYSPKDVEDYRIHHLVADVKGILEHLGGSAIVLGHDWGAAVAYALAMAYPEIVDKLIILNGVHPLPFQRALVESQDQIKASQYMHWLRRKGSEIILAQNDFEKLKTMFSHGMNMTWLKGARMDEYCHAWKGAEGLKTMVHWYRATGLYIPKAGEPIKPMPKMNAEQMRIIMPHLLLWGAGDTALLPEAFAGLDHLTDDFTLVDIEETDHWLHHQAPDVVAKTILNWV